ncbi:MAG: hypothetical protein OEM15_01160 [Myxococcales bacterium]|nr:hypothetical protein [Myxococcales bacterium]MDH3483750.1 hypothetical protein [Myxococcales bacterium]
MMRKECFIVVMLLSLAVACGESGDPSLSATGAGGGDGAIPDATASVGDGGTGGGEDGFVTVDGLYTVPVDDASLSPFATQPVLLDWRARNGEYRLDYDFPVELTGLSQRVSFEGQAQPDGSIELVGDLGSASCSADPTGARFVCTERFPQLEFDLTRLARDFEQRGLSAIEIARRLEVASIFQSDPIGVLSFSLE